MTSPRPTRAFTLLELLVVVGLISGLAALVLRGFTNSQGFGVRQAESALAGQLTLARASAIRLGRPVRLAVNLDSANVDERFALVAVLVQDANTGVWQIVSEPLRLGSEVRVVPSTSVPMVDGLVWPSNAVSTWTATASVNVTGLTAGSYGYIEFATTGGTSANRKLVIATINRSASGALFNSADQIRCFLLRGSGIATLIKEASGIP